MFKKIAIWFDKKMGLTHGVGFLIVLLAFAVLMQFVALAINVFRKFL